MIWAELKIATSPLFDVDPFRRSRTPSLTQARLDSCRQPIEGVQPTACEVQIAHGKVDYACVRSVSLLTLCQAQRQIRQTGPDMLLRNDRYMAQSRCPSMKAPLTGRLLS